MIDDKKFLRDLDRILDKAVISEHLKTAVIEIKEAILKKDYLLAADLSSVKSFITHTIILKNPEKNHLYHFREESDKNEKLIGRSVYGILDDIHFTLSMETKTIPNSMIVITANRVYGRQESKNTTSKTLNTISNERRSYATGAI